MGSASPRQVLPVCPPPSLSHTHMQVTHKAQPEYAPCGLHTQVHKPQRWECLSLKLTKQTNITSLIYHQDFFSHTQMRDPIPTTTKSSSHGYRGVVLHTQNASTWEAEGSS